jgi:DNA repair protein RecN (Recombination protein N)
MLSVLKIKNLALVEDLTWELGPRLVTVTGETGAGKSMIVGALKLILGDRAERELVRSGETHCTVEAVFELPNREEVNAILVRSGLEPCEEEVIVLKRVFSVTGKNKQFVNCSPATLQVLKELGEVLVDLHGPHDHQSLMSQERQLGMLDAYAACEPLVAAYRIAYGAWREAEADFEALRDAERATEQELGLLRFQVQEIKGAELKPNEELELEQQYAVAANSQKLIDAAVAVSRRLADGPTGVLGQMREAYRHVRELERIDDGTAPLVSGFESALVELEELERGLRRYVGGLEINPAEVARLEQRIDLIESLKRKYGGSVERVIAFGEQAERKLNAIEGRGEELHRLEQTAAERLREVRERGRVLSAARLQASPELAAEVASHLEDLGFRQSKFEIALRYLEVPGPSGMEQVDFLFAPNPGQPFKPLRVIASSGEMSRVMLAVKSALADEDSIPLMVFDEIDANVGGEIAHAVGRKMAALGEKHQVVAITHMPQVASLAHHHYLVVKTVEDGTTRSSLVEVKGERRVAEITRMLGGGGDSARALAQAMLSGAV